MENYLDAFLYLANWGSRWFMLRLPKKLLESLVGKESGLWAKVDELIATRQSKRCDEAVSLLQDLPDLPDMEGKSSDFSLNMSELHREHTRKTTLVDRFRKAKLLG